MLGQNMANWSVRTEKRSMAKNLQTNPVNPACKRTSSAAGKSRKPHTMDWAGQNPIIVCFVLFMGSRSGEERRRTLRKGKSIWRLMERSASSYVLVFSLSRPPGTRASPIQVSLFVAVKGKEATVRVSRNLFVLFRVYELSRT